MSNIYFDDVSIFIDSRQWYEQGATIADSGQ